VPLYNRYADCAEFLRHAHDWAESERSPAS
jgi:hypothetical protein